MGGLGVIWGVILGVILLIKSVIFDKNGHFSIKSVIFDPLKVTPKIGHFWPPKWPQNWSFLTPSKVDFEPQSEKGEKNRKSGLPEIYFLVLTRNLSILSPPDLIVKLGSDHPMTHWGYQRRLGRRPGASDRAGLSETDIQNPVCGQGIT